MEHAIPLLKGYGEVFRPLFQLQDRNGAAQASAEEAPVQTFHAALADPGVGAVAALVRESGIVVGTLPVANRYMIR